MRETNHLRSKERKCLNHKTPNSTTWRRKHFHSQISYNTLVRESQFTSITFFSSFFHSNIVLSISVVRQSLNTQHPVLRIGVTLFHFLKNTYCFKVLLEQLSKWILEFLETISPMKCWLRVKNWMFESPINRRLKYKNLNWRLKVKGIILSWKLTSIIFKLISTLNWWAFKSIHKIHWT